MKTGMMLLVALVAALAFGQSAHARGDRLVYQIEVTAPGSRSQGWHGTLYGRNGDAITIPPGETVTTPIGTFASVACTLPFRPCGMIRTDMIAWMKTHNGNVIMDSKSWAYRLYVTAEGTRSEGWRGELLHGGSAVDAPPGSSGRLLKPIRAPSESLTTPMGPFSWQESHVPWGRHGWFPVSWK